MEHDTGSDYSFSSLLPLATQDLNHALGDENSERQLYFIVFRMFFDTYDASNRKCFDPANSDDEEQEEQGNKRQRVSDEINAFPRRSAEDARKAVLTKLGKSFGNSNEDEIIVNEDHH